MFAIPRRPLAFLSALLVLFALGGSLVVLLIPSPDREWSLAAALRQDNLDPDFTGHGKLQLELPEEGEPPPEEEEVEEAAALPPEDPSPVLRKMYRGRQFFDDWEFEDFEDPTHGRANYVNRTYAYGHKLAYVTKKTGAAVIAMDAKTRLKGDAKRDSVRIRTKDTFGIGMFAIFDVAHLPSGYGAWPAFWLLGPNWPYGGEVDLIEQINMRQNNQMALHGGPGCMRNTTEPQTGKLARSDNCDSTASGQTSGCAVIDDKISFGPRFSKAGGGVWAVQWSTDGLFIWRWPRKSIPEDIRDEKPDPENWGIPVAAWSSSTCAALLNFPSWNFILDITVCGDWAGDQTTWLKSGVPAKYRTCEEGVRDPQLFTDAFWKINYLAMYST